MVKIENRKSPIIQIPYLRNCLMIEPIGFCNLKCRYCCYRDYGDRQLEKDDIISFVDRFINYVNEPVELFWTGYGEITLYKHFSDLVNRFSRLYPSTRHYIQTNGILNSFIDDIKRLDNLVIGVSLDGFEEDNNYNRGEGTYEKILSSIEKFASLGVKINVHSIITPRSLKRAREFMSFIKSIDETISVTFATLYTTDPNIDINGMYENIHENYPDIECRLGMSVDDIKDDSRYACIDSHGFIYDCCDLINKIGNIHTSEPKDVLSIIESSELCNKCSYRKNCYPDIFIE